MHDIAFQQCIEPPCRATLGVDEVHYACPRCGGMLDVQYDWSQVEVPRSLSSFAARWSSVGRSPSALADFSGVWRFRELLPFAGVEELVTIGEGRTQLQRADALAMHIHMHPGALFLQYEGFNPSGSFKDNGMTAALTIARRLGRRRVACASTGNTSASLALYAAHATRDKFAIQAVVFVGGGKIAFGKLAQALDFGATTLQVEGDFDACMKLVQEAAAKLNLYLVNSVNPFRLEGQKSIMYRVLEGLDWQPPDWIVVPGGNLGNSSAFGKAFMELRQLGLLDRIPRLAIINAGGANSLYELHERRGVRFHQGRWDRATVDRYFEEWTSSHRTAKTIASAIEIGRPVNLPKALRALEVMNGVVRQVTDEQILDAKALVGRFGYGCEPASAASVAGVRVLREEGIIASSDRVVCILTGHGLKDADATVNFHCSSAADANAPIPCAASLDAISAALQHSETHR